MSNVSIIHRFIYTYIVEVFIVDDSIPIGVCSLKEIHQRIFKHFVLEKAKTEIHMPLDFGGRRHSYN